MRALWQYEGLIGLMRARLELGGTPAQERAWRVKLEATEAELEDVQRAARGELPIRRDLVA